jgi:hypothetical protein
LPNSDTQNSSIPYTAAFSGQQYSQPQPAAASLNKQALNMFPGGFQTEEVVTPSRLLHLNEGFSDLGKNEP